MKIESSKQANYLLVTDPCVAPKYLLGATRVKKTNTYRVEENLINLHQLGLSLPKSLRVPVDDDDVFLESTLFSYQKEDILRKIGQKSILNANPMGYGKTVETVVTLRERGVRNALILAPKAVLLQWKNELEKWWEPYYQSQTTFGRPKIQVLSSGDEYKPTRDSIVITNYDALLNTQRLIRLKMFSWDALVLDESHRIKNRKSKTWAAVTSISAKYKMALTGTPILRKIDDLWAQLYALDWRYSGNSYWNFLEFFCTVQDGHFGGKEVGGLSKDPEKVRLLNWLIEQIAIRQPDLKLTPGKRSSVVDLKMSSSQKGAYKEARDLAFDTLPEELTITNAMSHLLRLRQLTSCPEQFYPNIDNVKFDWIQTILEDNPTLKIVLLSTWATPLKTLASKLNVFPFDEGGFMQLYTGSMSIEEREASKQRFIEDPSVRILGGTIGALGTGVDGLQKATNTVVFLDRDWSPEINAQAEDRLNRFGQIDAVNVYYLECVGTMDLHVARINLTKAEDIRKALKEEL